MKLLLLKKMIRWWDTLIVCRAQSPLLSLEQHGVSHGSIDARCEVSATALGFGRRLGRLRLATGRRQESPIGHPFALSFPITQFHLSSEAD